MSTYALGDLHGCFATLQALLARLPFDPERDRLWLVGDLVNRGPASVAVLRWARELAGRMGERFAAVLGNHDLRLLACHRGLARPKGLDTLDEFLAAPDRDELAAWLAGLPFVHREDGLLLVHAGLHPAWTPAEALARARRLEAAFGTGGPTLDALLTRQKPDETEAAGDTGLADLRASLAAFTRLRTCTDGGVPCEDFSGPPAEAPPGCLPWFAVPGRASAGTPVVCGHWAALGLHLAPDLLALDSGVVWGQKLTAIRLDDRRVWQQAAREPWGSG